jgi:hypothetical protein
LKGSLKEENCKYELFILKQNIFHYLLIYLVIIYKKRKETQKKPTKKVLKYIKSRKP